MKHSRTGFTVVELLIVIVVIGVLATITIVGMTKYQGDARDAQRTAKATIISEALEKYYGEHGEYPSVRNLVNTYSSNTPNAIANMLEVSPDNITMPRSSNPQSIAPTTTTDENVIIYNGTSTVNNNGCQTSETGGCDRYSLTYKTDTGEDVVINSRHDSSVFATVSEAPLKPDLSVTGGASNTVVAESSDANCVGNSDRLVAKYLFSYKINNGAWIAGSTWTTETSYSRAGASGSTYSFTVQSRCDDGTVAGTPSPISEIVSYVVPVGAPNAPAVAVALSDGAVVATITAVSCPSSTTTQYAFRSRTNTNAWSAYSAWSSSLTASQAATQGVKYTYQAQARCYSSSLTSPESTGAEKFYTHPLSAPAPPEASQSTSGTLTSFTISAVTCPSGSTTRYQYRLMADWDYTGAWNGPYSTIPKPSWTTTNEGYEYKMEVRAHCYNVNSTSDWSGTGWTSYVRPVGNPSNATFDGWRGDYRTIYLSATTTCGPGVYPDMRADVHTWDFNWVPTPPTAYGWYRDRFGSWVVNTLQYYGTTLKTGSSTNNSNGIPNGSRWNISVDKRCRNHTTGRTSPIYYQESGAYAL